MAAPKTRGKHPVFGGAPRVDLLPARQRAELLHERTMPRLLLAIVLTALVTGLIWAAGMVPNYFVDQQLRDSTARNRAALGELQNHAEVQQTLGGFAALNGLRTQLTADEVLIATVHDEVAAHLPDGATLTDFTMRLMADGVPLPGELDLQPLCTGANATLVLDVQTTQLTPASDFSAALAQLTGFQCVAVTGLTERTATVQVGLGPDAVSGRFAPEVKQ